MTQQERPGKNKTERERRRQNRQDRQDRTGEGRARQGKTGQAKAGHATMTDPDSRNRAAGSSEAYKSAPTIIRAGPPGNYSELYVLTSIYGQARNHGAAQNTMDEAQNIGTYYCEWIFFIIANEKFITLITHKFIKSRTHIYSTVSIQN